jgi:hypothetical protein
MPGHPERRIAAGQDLRPTSGTLTRNTITIGDRTFDKISTPTETQQRAFNLLGAPILLSLAS